MRLSSPSAASVHAAGMLRQLNCESIARPRVSG
jgi:hypothetical protein